MTPHESHLCGEIIMSFGPLAAAWAIGSFFSLHVHCRCVILYSSPAHTSPFIRSVIIQPNNNNDGSRRRRDLRVHVRYCGIPHAVDCLLHEQLVDAGSGSSSTLKKRYQQRQQPPPSRSIYRCGQHDVPLTPPSSFFSGTSSCSRRGGSSSACSVHRSQQLSSAPAKTGHPGHPCHRGERCPLQHSSCPHLLPPSNLRRCLRLLSIRRVLKLGGSCEYIYLCFFYMQGARRTASIHASNHVQWPHPNNMHFLISSFHIQLLPT